jgi:hypothetical protein
MCVSLGAAGDNPAIRPGGDKPGNGLLTREHGEAFRNYPWIERSARRFSKTLDARDYHSVSIMSRDFA